jgi:hypothetical protein
MKREGMLDTTVLLEIIDRRDQLWDILSTNRPFQKEKLVEKIAQSGTPRITNRKP